VVEFPHSKLKESISRVLRREGYVSKVVVEGLLSKKVIKLGLKYEGADSAIQGLKRISKPGIRRYVGVAKIPNVKSGLGISIMSTPEGVMSSGEARKKNLGGELLCVIW
jgi:small subunit ribosomal protein S8